MPRLASALTSAAAALGGFLGPAFAQDLRVVDSFTRLVAAYDAARGRIVTLGLAGETCELDGAVVRHLPVPRVTYWPGGLVRSPDGRSLMLVGDDSTQTVTSLFDGVAWQPRAGIAPSRRSSFALVCDEARAEVLMFGGHGASFTALGETWTFDGTTWTQRQPATAPPARMGASTVYDAARTRVVLFGGKDASSLVSFSDTWEWNGATWAAASPVNAPSPRGWSGLAYDAARNRIVLFGGAQDTAVFGDTWEYDGIDWHAMQVPVPMPGARAAAQLVFDVARGETVMLDGVNSEFLRDAWTWNGVRWQPIPSPPAPIPRTGLTFADPAGTGLIVADYRQTPSTWRWNASGWTQLAAVPPPQRIGAATTADPTRVLVFGGSDGLPNLLNDLWSFDGTTWSLLANGGPSPRIGAAMAHDLSSGNVVLFGGNDLNVASGDTWTFDGVAWTQRQPPTSPSVRSGAVATYDFGRQRVVLFGGHGPNGRLDDTWEWNGTTWAPVASPAMPLPLGELSLAFDLSRGRTVLAESAGGLLPLSAWSLEASGWVPVVVGQATTLNSLSGTKSAHGFPFLNGLLLADEHHVYSLSAQQAEVERYGAACTASAPALMANSWPRLGAADFAVEVVGGPANSFVALVGAVQSASLPIGGCTLLVQPGQLAVLLATSGSGFVRSPLPVPANYALLGVELFFQAASLEASAPAGFTLSRGLRLRIGH